MNHIRWDARQSRSRSWVVKTNRDAARCIGIRPQHVNGGFGPQRVPHRGPRQHAPCGPAGAAPPSASAPCVPGATATGAASAAQRLYTVGAQAGSRHISVAVTTNVACYGNACSMLWHGSMHECDVPDVPAPAVQPRSVSPAGCAPAPRALGCPHQGAEARQTHQVRAAPGGWGGGRAGRTSSPSAAVGRLRQSKRVLTRGVRRAQAAPVSGNRVGGGAMRPHRLRGEQPQ